MPVVEAERAVGALVLGAIDAREPTAMTRELLQEGALGGVTLFRRNVDDDLASLARRMAELHAIAARRLVVAIDQEGGRVARLRFSPVIQLPPAAELGDRFDFDAVERLGYEVGFQLRALGFTMNFAPVLDLHSEPQNPVIGDRAFGSTHDAATAKALAFARGQRRAGLASCGKHFPGHGDTTTDSHVALPHVDAPREVLDRREFEPFRAAARAGLEAFMSAHVVYPAIDSRPCTLSHSLATTILRNEIRFDGVLFSDDLRMKALSDDTGANAVAAIAAGCDAVLVCEGEELVRDVVARLAREYAASEAFRARVGEARRRVGALTDTCPAAPITDAPSLMLALEAANRRALRLMAGLDP
jgi:beta-N-acetylhexosaminidase